MIIDHHRWHASGFIVHVNVNHLAQVKVNQGTQVQGVCVLIVRLAGSHIQETLMVVQKPGNRQFVGFGYRQ